MKDHTEEQSESETRKAKVISGQQESLIKRKAKQKYCT